MAVPYQRHQKKDNSSREESEINHHSLILILIYSEGSHFGFGIRSEHIKLFKSSKGKLLYVNMLSAFLARIIRNILLFDYQKLIFDAIENNQNIWILKVGV